MSNLEYCLTKAREIPYVKGRQRIYSVALDKRGKILSESANSYIQSHPVQAMYAKKAGLEHKVYLHSEIRTIIKSREKAIDKLIIVRIDSKGRALDACPCIICRQAIKDAKIKTVEYSIGE